MFHVFRNCFAASLAASLEMIGLHFPCVLFILSGSFYIVFMLLIPKQTAYHEHCGIIDYTILQMPQCREQITLGQRAII